MKILVTGSAGFIGSAFSIRLLDRGDIDIDNNNNSKDEQFKGVIKKTRIGMFFNGVE